MKRVRSRRPALHDRIRSHGTKLLILDFDGTLTPIVKDPGSVELGERTRKTLKELSGRRDYTVAIISGRSLKDLRSRTRLPNVIHIGNHGLEMSGGGVKLPADAKKAYSATRSMRLLAEKLKNTFYFWPGVLVEDKGFTLSVHFRNLHTRARPAFQELIKFYRQKFKRFPIVWRRGKMVWEVRPYPKWGKGDAVSQLRRKFPWSFPIVLGDDRTDEDMFRSVRNKGITIRVGHSKKSHASAFLRSQGDVRHFLEKLCR